MINEIKCLTSYSEVVWNIDKTRVSKPQLWRAFQVPVCPQTLLAEGVNTRSDLKGHLLGCSPVKLGMEPQLKMAQILISFPITNSSKKFNGNVRGGYFKNLTEFLLFRAKFGNFLSFILRYLEEWSGGQNMAYKIF